MGKKGKSSLALAEDFKSLITMIPKLKALIKTHNEIATAYQTHRENGGEAISGIEKHLGIKIAKNTGKAKTIEPEIASEAPKKDTNAKKSAKKVKK